MTGYTVHTGSTESFSQGWDRIFGGEPRKPQKTRSNKTPAATTAERKKPAKPRAARKKS